MCVIRKGAHTPCQRMLKADGHSRLFCAHYVSSDVECPECRSKEKDYANRPLYAPLYVPLPKLSTALDEAQLKLPSTFYAPQNETFSSPKTSNVPFNGCVPNDCLEIQTNKGTVRVPRSALVHRSQLAGSIGESCNAAPNFPGPFENRAHRFTRSFSWKTKPEESPFTRMKPLPKLIKKPGYLAICFKSQSSNRRRVRMLISCLPRLDMCWSGHQLCLCCGRNTAESCRKWSKSTGEYDYIDACWSSCALCSDDAYKILNTPVVYNEKIIDPELLLPLDAELLYYSIQSAKRQREKQRNSPPGATKSPLRPRPMSGGQKGEKVPFADLTRLRKASRKARRSPRKPKRKAKSKRSSRSSRRPRAPRKVRSSKAVRPKKSSRSSRRKTKKKKRRTSRKPSRSSRSRSRTRSKRGSKKRSSRSKRRSKSRK